MQLPVHVASTTGNKNCLKKIIESAPSEMLETKDTLGRTPLMLSVLYNQLECAVILLKAGVHVDNSDHAGQTALHVAINKGFHRYVKLLLSFNASWYQKDFCGITPIHLAGVQLNSKCLALILKKLKPGETDIQDSTKQTPLHWSAAYSNINHVKMLLQQGANICIPDEEGKTPLHWAATNSGPQALACVRILLEKAKRLVNWQDYEGRSALHLAVATGSTEVVRYLASKEDCNIDILDNAFCTPLHWAAKKGLDEKVGVLLSKMACHKSADDNGATPLHYAAYNNHAKVVEVFLSRNYIDDIGDLEGRNAVIWASARNADDVLRVMAACNVSLTCADKNGSTALHAAALQGHTSSIELLLSFGIPVDIRDKSGLTPLLKACELGRVKAAEFMLDFGADRHAVDINGCSALHWSAYGGHAYLCQILLHSGAACNNQDLFGRVPLHYACMMNGYINCVSVLLESGANPNIADCEGKTPLHWAVLNNYQGVAKLLCEYDADTNAMALIDEWCTPLDCAISKDNPEMIILVKKYGGLRCDEIKELAASKIQIWYREARKWKISCKKSKAISCRKLHTKKTNSEKYFRNSSITLLKQAQTENTKKTSPQLSKIPMPVWRYSDPSERFREHICEITRSSSMTDDTQMNIAEIIDIENVSAAVIQRAWRKYSLKSKFRRMREKIKVTFSTDEKRARAEKSWTIKLTSFYKQF